MVSAKCEAAAMASARRNRTAATASAGREASGGHERNVKLRRWPAQDATGLRQQSARDVRQAASSVHPAASERKARARASVCERRYDLYERSSMPALAFNAWRCEQASSNANERRKS